jgi:hypothetical protein
LVGGGGAEPIPYTSVVMTTGRMGSQCMNPVAMVTSRQMGRRRHGPNGGGGDQADGEAATWTRWWWRRRRGLGDVEEGIEKFVSPTASK